MKTCTKCKEEKDKSYFSKDSKSKDGRSYYCKKCLNENSKKWKKNNEEKNKDYKKRYRQNNKEKEKKSHLVWWKKNEEKMKILHREWLQNNKDKTRKKAKEWNAKNKDKLTSYRRKAKIKKMANDPLFKLREQVSGLIRNALKVRGFHKKTRTQELLGCSPLDFQQHMGKRPEEKHSIDHICPCAQAKNEEELIKLQHYSTLRWLPAKENLDKKHYMTPEGEVLCRTLLDRDWVA
jgi:hypothetical protein